MLIQQHQLFLVLFYLFVCFWLIFVFCFFSQNFTSKLFMALRLGCFFGRNHLPECLKFSLLISVLAGNFSQFVFAIMSFMFGLISTIIFFFSSFLVLFLSQSSCSFLISSCLEITSYFFVRPKVMTMFALLLNNPRM